MAVSVYREGILKGVAESVDELVKIAGVGADVAQDLWSGAFPLYGSSVFAHAGFNMYNALAFDKHMRIFISSFDEQWMTMEVEQESVEGIKRYSIDVPVLALKSYEVIINTNGILSLGEKFIFEEERELVFYLEDGASDEYLKSGKRRELFQYFSHVVSPQPERDYESCSLVSIIVLKSGIYGFYLCGPGTKAVSYSGEVYELTANTDIMRMSLWADDILFLEKRGIDWKMFVKSWEEKHA